MNYEWAISLAAAAISSGLMFGSLKATNIGEATIQGVATWVSIYIAINLLAHAFR